MLKTFKKITYIKLLDQESKEVVEFSPLNSKEIREIEDLLHEKNYSILKIKGVL